METVRWEDVHRVGVVGAGTMGLGIAQVFALAGYEVRLFDGLAGVADAALETIRANLQEGVDRGKVTLEAKRQALSSLSSVKVLQEAVEGADVVIEAVPEKLQLKMELFAALGKICRPEALLASNTSSLSLTRIAASAAQPERVLGLHFFNPPHKMNLLEVVRGRETSEATLATALGLARRLGKEAIVVRDSPGFATSRLGVALGLEAMRMVQEEVASPEDIDKAMELGYGHPMGPLRVSDLVGLDVRLSIAETLQRELESPRFQPPRILLDKVQQGKLGKKSGEGFYRWEK